MTYHTLLAAAAALLVAACATPETAPGTVNKAVAEPPCSPGKAPKRPVFPADTLTGDEDLFTLGKTLWADRKARQAYQREAEIFIDECTRTGGPP